METFKMALELAYQASLLMLFAYKVTDVFEYINELGGFKVAPRRTIARFIFWVALYFGWFIL